MSRSKGGEAAKAAEEDDGSQGIGADAATGDAGEVEGVDGLGAAEAARRAEATEGPGRGRRAVRPRDIPKRGWWDILLRIKDSISRDNLSLISAGVAFYAMLAAFPACIALVSVYGLIADPADIMKAFELVGRVLPKDAQVIFLDQLREITAASNTGLSWGLALSIVAVMWSASSGVSALIRGLDVAYGESEQRSFVKLRLISLAFTLGFVVFAVVSLVLVAVLPAVLGLIGLGEVTEWALRIGRWPSLGIAVIAGLSALYHFGPDRDRPRWRWVTVGSGVATILWVLFSGLFSFYVTHFGSYNETYGALAGVIVLLMWFYLTAFVMLLGAEINAEVEHQTAKDSTVGPPEPLGQRGANKADTMGKAHPR